MNKLSQILGASWIPKVIGGLIALLEAAKGYGVTIGHIGHGDWLDFTLVLLVAGFAFSVKQSNVHGGTVGQPTTLEAKAVVAEPMPNQHNPAAG